LSGLRSCPNASSIRLYHEIIFIFSPLFHNSNLRILFLTQILPYPPDSGPRVKTWNVLRYLVGQGHDVTLISFMRKEEKAFLPVLQEMCQVYPVPIRRSRLADALYWLKSLVSKRPFLIERDDFPAMRRQIKQLRKSRTFDVVHADQLTMTQFALAFPESTPRPRLVFDAHNATWTIVERMRQNARAILKPVLSLEVQRVAYYEGNLLRQFDHTMAVTEIDRQALLKAAEIDRREVPADRVQVIPIAIDTTVLIPVQRDVDSHNIIAMGTLLYPPNADGVRWFANEVFPLIQRQVPDATLTIIGKGAPADLVRLASQSSGRTTITGYVPDLVPYLERAAVMVVPVRAGGGMRVRILEAFARGIPIVTTSIGLEGIDAEPGEDVLVEDTPELFAKAVVQLLKDPAMQTRLAANGRRLVETCYDWQVVLRKLDDIYA